MYDLQRDKKGKQSSRGFTLAELLIVVAITGILAAFGFVQVAKHRRELKLTEMDNIAREIFVAAQNHLTESQSTGEWGKLYDKKAGDGTYLGEVAGGTIKTSDSFSHDWRAFVVQSNIQAMEDKNTSAFSYLLPFGAADPEVRDSGCYVIRYDALNAAVYDVFYTENANGIALGDLPGFEPEAGKFPGNLRIQFEKNGAKYPVGYYGGGITYNVDQEEDKPEDEPVDIAVAPQMSILNEERLLLVVDDPNGNKDDLKIVLHGAVSGQEYVLLETNAGTLTTNFASSIIDDEQKSCRRYVFILDSVADQSMHFGRRFSDFMLGENIYATADVSLKTITSQTKKEIESEASGQSNTANSLFDDRSTTGIAKVSNGRHLANLSQEISGANQVESAVITENIVWSSEDFTTRGSGTFFGNLLMEDEAYRLSLNDADTKVYYFNGAEGENYAFPGIASNTIQVLEGENGKSISNLHIVPSGKNHLVSGIDGTDVGLISRISLGREGNLRINNININNAKVDGSTGGAGILLGRFENEASGKLYIDQVVVDNSAISAGNAMGVGGLVGYVGSGGIMVTDSHVKGTSKDISFKGQNIGGLIGMVKGTNHRVASITISGSGLETTKSILLEGTGKGAAGGIIGQTWANIGNIMIDNCTVVADKNINISSAGGNSAGGIVGLLDRHESGTASLIGVMVEAKEDISIWAKMGNIADSNYKVTGSGGLIGTAGHLLSDADNGSNGLGKLSVTAGTVKAKNYSNGTGSDHARYAGGAIGAIGGEVGGGKHNAGVTLSSIQVDVAENLSVSLKNEGSVGGLIGNIGEDQGIVELKNSSVSANKATLEGITTAAGLVGEVSAPRIKMIEVFAVTGKDGSVKASHAAGGLIGKIRSNDLSICDSYSSTTVEATAGNDGIAGGFVGLVTSLQGNNTLKFDMERCYASGRTSDKKYPETSNVSAPVCAGGFVGQISHNTAGSSIKNSYTTESVGGIQSNSVNGCGYGGFIGSSYGAASSFTIENCYSTGAVNNGSAIVSGVFAGYNDGAAKAIAGNKDNFALDGINETFQTVVGKETTASSKALAVLATPKSTESGNPFNVDETAQKNAEPYDTTRAAGEKYPYMTTAQLAGLTVEKEKDQNKIHVGDWPDPVEVEEGERTYKGNIGVIYYERVQHGDGNFSDGEYYYHGYVGDLTEDGSELNFEEVWTNDTGKKLTTPKKTRVMSPNNEKGLLTDHKEYVTESGYILLVSDDYLTEMPLDLNAVPEGTKILNIRIGDGDNENNAYMTSLKLRLDQHSVTEFTNFTDSFGLYGYKAYVITNPENTRLAGGKAELKFEIVSKSDNSNQYNATGTVLKQGSFCFRPAFSDSLWKSEEEIPSDPVYKIRSADALKTMIGGEGYNFKTFAKNGKLTLLQTLDISYDKAKVHFTWLGKEVTDNDKYISAQHNQNPFVYLYKGSTPYEESKGVGTNDKTYYRLDGLNRYFMQGIGNGGKIENVYVQNSTADYFLSDGVKNNGILENCIFENSAFTNHWVSQVYNDGVLNGIKFKDVTFNHIFGDMNGKAYDFTFNNVTFNDYGVRDIKGKIWNWNLQDINGKHLVDYISSGGSVGIDSSGKYINGLTIKGATITGDAGVIKKSQGRVYQSSIINASITGDGFIQTNEGTIEKCSVENAAIGGNGFCGDNSGAIDQSEVKHAEIGGNGFAGSNIYSNGKITNCNVINARIGENGFVGNNVLMIQNCHVYADNVDYANYLSENDAAIQKFNVDTNHVDDSVIETGDERGKQGYNLVVIGIKQQEHIGDVIGGFAGTNGENAHIYSCSVTGKIFGHTAASGFVNENQGTIKGCYANTIVSATGVASGFVQINNKNVISMSHSTGMLNGSSQSGFVDNNAGGSIKNCYSAIWSMKGSRKYTFYQNKSDDNIKNCVYLKEDGISGATESAGVSSVNATTLANTGALGGNLSAEYCMPYNQYFDLTGKNYPYPMPVIYDTDGNETDGVMIQYGDWPTRTSSILMKGAELVEILRNSGATSVKFVNFSALSNKEVKNPTDVSNIGNGSVLGWLDVSDKTYYIYAKNANSVIQFNEDCKKMFCAVSLKSVDFGKGVIDSTSVNDMSQMFGYEKNEVKIQEIINLTELATNKVTKMDRMFQNYDGIMLDLSNFSTEQTTHMESMFEGCKNLVEIKGIENFSTVKVTSMKEMFKDCVALSELNLEKWDTSSVTSDEAMNDIFTGCIRLQKIQLGPKFLWKGNTASLPIPDASYIPEANGVWYQIGENEVAAVQKVNDLIRPTNGTFYAYKPFIIAFEQNYPEDAANNGIQVTPIVIKGNISGSTQVTLPQNTGVAAGYNFECWEVNIDGSLSEYAENQTVKLEQLGYTEETSVVVVKGIWKKNVKPEVMIGVTVTNQNKDEGNKVNYLKANLEDNTGGEIREVEFRIVFEFDKAITRADAWIGEYRDITIQGNTVTITGKIWKNGLNGVQDFHFFVSEGTPNCIRCSASYSEIN